jgi:hypothetical protein
MNEEKFERTKTCKGDACKVDQADITGGKVISL